MLGHIQITSNPFSGNDELPGQSDMLDELDYQERCRQLEVMDCGLFPGFYTGQFETIEDIVNSTMSCKKKNLHYEILCNYPPSPLPPSILSFYLPLKKKTSVNLPRCVCVWTLLTHSSRPHRIHNDTIICIVVLMCVCMIFLFFFKTKINK